MAQLLPRPSVACASQGLQDCAPQEGASQGPEDGPDSLPQGTEDGPGSVPQGPEDAPDLALQSSHRLQECQAAAAQLAATVEEARVEMSGAVAQHDSMVDESAGDGPESAADANTGVLLHCLSQAASADACPGTQMPTADESSSKHASVTQQLPGQAFESQRKSTHPLPCRVHNFLLRLTQQRPAQACAHMQQVTQALQGQAARHLLI